MKTADLTMTRAQAGAELEKYQGATTVEDQLIQRAYRAMKKGKRLLDLHDSFKLAGADELGRPKIAIGRADWPTVEFQMWNGNDYASFSKLDSRWSTKSIRIPRSALLGVHAKQGEGQLRLRAITPTIPPKFRPSPSNLKKYFILWEAEWKDVPVDPLLLQHLGGTLYLVLAAWDLTAVERSVLRGTR